MISVKDAVEITKEYSKYDIISKGIEDAIIDAAADGRSYCEYGIPDDLLKNDIGMDETKLEKLITDMKNDGYKVLVTQNNWNWGTGSRYISISWNPDSKLGEESTIVPFDEGMLPTKTDNPSVEFQCAMALVDMEKRSQKHKPEEKDRVGFWKRLWILLTGKGEYNKNE